MTEATAILEAIKTVKKKEQSIFLILSDSQSTLNSIKTNSNQEI